MGQTQDPVILHADLNSFFASVELLFHPELRDVPMAVAGDQAQRHGIILAKNEAAKAFGVKTAETIWQARRKCPALQLVPPRHDLYHEYSLKAREVFVSLTDRVESFGLDEAWLDVTGSIALFGSGREIADLLRQRMRERLGLTCSVGVSFTKAFAKIGSDLRKPDATTVISRADVPRLIWPLPVQSLLFVGAATAARLDRIGIRTIGQLAACPAGTLKEILGKNGEALWMTANGLGDTPVAPADQKRDPKSISASTTTARDLTRLEEVRPILFALADDVAARLRAAGLQAGTVRIEMVDNTFTRLERQRQMRPPTDLADDIAPAAVSLFAEHYTWQHPIRLLGIHAGSLRSRDAPRQLELTDLNALPDPQSTPDGQSAVQDSQPVKQKRRSELERTMDQIRERFGEKAAKRAVELTRSDQNPSSEDLL